MAKDAVEIWLFLRDVRKFIEDANKAGKAVTGVGTAAEKSGKKAGLGWKGVAKWAGGAAAIYAGTKFLKSSVGATTDLARSTLQLQRVTGMETETASEWVGVLKQRHVSTQLFGRSLAQLSKQMEKSRTGTNVQTSTMRKLRREYEAVSAVGGKKAPAALARIQRQMDSARKRGDNARKTFAMLGVSMDAIRKGDTQEVIKQVAERFKTMENPAQRAAAAQLLFGRSAQRLLPLLMAGREGIQENLEMQKKYGNVIGGKTLADTRKLIHEQHEMEAAFSGLKVQLGTALLPVVMDVVGVIVSLTRALQPILRNKNLMVGVIIAITAAFVAYKIAVIAATIAQLGLDAATWAWIGVALLIVALIIGIGIGLYKLYQHSETFRAAVDAMWKAVRIGAQWAWDKLQQLWRWVKSNWPYLLGALAGPFGIAVVYIVRHFDKIKKAVGDAVQWIKDKFNELVTFVKDLPKRLGGGILDRLTGVASKISGAASHIPGVSLFGGQHGGVVPRRSPVLVGEGGPELLTLPRGAMVRPLPQPVGFAADAMVGPIYLQSQLVVDRKVLAQAVAQHTADKRARR